MPIVFKYVTRPDDPRPQGSIPMPLGLLTDAENEDYPDLMIGTDCANPATLNAYANWHFRVENVPASYIADDVYPRQIDGPVPETYGTWLHADHIPCRENCACNELGNWPLYFIQTQNADGTYTWDLFIVPYLGGSVTAGVEPKLPLPNTQYQLELYDSYNEQTYTIITSESIPELYPIFGTTRGGKSNEDFYPADFGFDYQQGSHLGVDIVPKGLFASGTPDSDWDLPVGGANEVYRSVFAVAAGQVVHTEGETGLSIKVLDSSSPYYNLEFRYHHVIDRYTQWEDVPAGTEIAKIRNHQSDPNSNATHLHFEVKDLTNNRIVDPRQFIYPGYIPNP